MQRCEHCGGSLLVEPDEFGLRRVCMSCGRETPLQSTSTDTRDWKALALEDLKDKIRQVQAVDGIKTEAEQTAAARSAAAVPNIPELPWKPTKAGQNTKRTAPTFGICVKCGRTFTGSRQSMRDADGQLVCRVGGCAEQTTELATA
jgi:DNA-directed RNA polymerase subunit M/transcription elongation factor TFIIS